MLQMKLATAALLALTAATALAQAPSLDNLIWAADTNSAIAPARLNTRVADNTRVVDNANPRAFLRAAHAALVSGRTVEAQEALETAETRLLARAAPPDQAATAAHDPTISRIREALLALGNGDRAHAIQIVNSALAS